MYTLAECRAASQAADNLERAACSNTMRDYWRGVKDMWERRARELERNSLALDRLAAGIQVECPEPVRWGNDQVKCHKCNRIWDNSEEKPPCT